MKFDSELGACAGPVALSAPVSEQREHPSSTGRSSARGWGQGTAANRNALLAAEVKRVHGAVLLHGGDLWRVFLPSFLAETSPDSKGKRNRRDLRRSSGPASCSKRG